MTKRLPHTASFPACKTTISLGDILDMGHCPILEDAEGGKRYEVRGINAGEVQLYDLQNQATFQFCRAELDSRLVDGRVKILSR